MLMKALLNRLHMGVLEEYLIDIKTLSKNNNNQKKHENLAFNIID
jgi:hypothetical protein